MSNYTTNTDKSQDVRITALEMSNVKRIKAVALEPAPAGLTVIGGKNGQGKTSVLDGIAWALGGERFRPDAAKREGSVLDPELRVQLSNGLTVIRKGPKSALTVVDETGKRSGQQLLNEFVETLALDLPKFLHASDKERASILLGILGIQDQLDALEREERAKYDTRLQIGRDRDRAQHYAEELPWNDGVPENEVSIADLKAEMEAAQAIIRSNMQKRAALERVQNDAEHLLEQIDELKERYQTAMATAKKLADEVQRLPIAPDTDRIVQRMQDMEATNAKVRENKAHQEADQRASLLVDEYDALTGEIEDVRARRVALLEGADMPLPGLSVQEGVLYYNGQPWSCMSSAEQMRAATAIVGRLKPECRFVLVDRLETMDTDTLREFGAWAAERGLQVIGTRVSTGGECTVVIEDGEVVESAPAAPKWKEGTF